jgi:hypothetical protein
MRIQRSILAPSCPKLVQNTPFAAQKAIFCVLGLLASLATAQAGTLFLATASGSPGELYIINPATGAVVKDVGPLNDSSSVNYAVTGLAFHPTTGVLYGSSGAADAATSTRLLTINPETAQVTVVGLFNAANATMADLAFDSAGNLYGVASKNGPDIYSIDLTTAQATQIGNTFLTSTGGGGFSIDSAGVIWGSPTASRFGTYSLFDGTFVNNGTLDKPAGGGAYAALAFDENNVLYGLNSGPANPIGTPPPTHLVIINPNDLTVTDIGASVNAGDAIAFQPPVATPPSLTIATQGVSQATLRWPDAPGFQLEYKASLNNSIWLTNTTSPTVDNGTNVVTVPVQNSSFFRLHKP